MGAPALGPLKEGFHDFGSLSSAPGFWKLPPVQQKSRLSEVVTGLVTCLPSSLFVERLHFYRALWGAAFEHVYVWCGRPGKTLSPGKTLRPGTLSALGKASQYTDLMETISPSLHMLS